MGEVILCSKKDREKKTHFSSPCVTHFNGWETTSTKLADSAEALSKYSPVESFGNRYKQDYV